MEAEPKYSCTFSGLCEEDPDGDYDTLEQCQGECQSVEQKELLYLTIAYDPELITQLAPSDQVYVARAHYNLTLSPEEAQLYFLILEGLQEEGPLLEKLKDVAHHLEELWRLNPTLWNAFPAFTPVDVVIAHLSFFLIGPHYDYSAYPSQRERINTIFRTLLTTQDLELREDNIYYLLTMFLPEEIVSFNEVFQEFQEHLRSALEIYLPALNYYYA